MAESREEPKVEEPKVVDKDSLIAQLEMISKQRDHALEEFVDAHTKYNSHKQKMIRTGDQSDKSRAKRMELKKKMQRLDHIFKAFDSEYQEMLKRHVDA